MKTVSVIVPIYNVEPYLRECLDRVCGQAYENMQIILIDDGSTDGSGLICDQYAEKDNRVTVVHQKNRGLVAARKKGIELATGKYITFVDGDDWIDEGGIEKIVSFISDDQNVDVLAFHCIEEYSSYQIIKKI